MHDVFHRKENGKRKFRWHKIDLCALCGEKGCFLVFFFFRQRVFCTIILSKFDRNLYLIICFNLCRGKFGTVYRCTEKETGLKLAAKFINIAKRQDRRNAEREVDIMKELQHPRLIQLYDAYEMNNIMCVVLEL